MTSNVPGYSLKLSFSQISSWHGTRVDSTSIHAVRYEAKKSGPGQSFSAVELRAFSFPFTMPNIMDWSSHGSLKNDLFTWSDNGSDYSVTIPEAPYDGPTLASTLQTLMNAVISQYIVAYDPITGVFQFSTSSGGNISVTPDATWPWLELGFCLNETTNGTGGVMTSTAVANLQGSSHLFISIPELQSANSINYNGASITFAIPINVASTYVDHWSYLTSPSNKFYMSPTERTLTGYTIFLYFERAGVLYTVVGDCNSSYTLNLAYFSFQL